MTDPEQDEAFESYLKRRSVLPEDRLEPPAALDAIVLKKAREAIKAPAAPETGKQQMQRAPRWAVPVALAATIMLCLSVVMNISLNTNRPTQRLTAARDDSDRRESVPGDIPSREVILPEAKVAEAPAPRGPVVADQGVGAPPGGNASMASAPAAALAAAPAADEPRVAARARGALQPANEGSQVDSKVDSKAAAADRSQAAASGGPKHPADPRAWLRQIDALRAAGKNALADAEMGRFRAAFPGYAAKPATPASSEPPK